MLYQIASHKIATSHNKATASGPRPKTQRVASVEKNNAQQQNSKVAQISMHLI
jgi:hypothetical protein